MEKHIYDAYIADGWKLFALYIPSKEKVESGEVKLVKGNYSCPPKWNDMSRPSDNYNPKSVYGGVPPKDIIVFDYDVKNGKVGEVSKLALEKAVGQTLHPTVITASKGGHIYVRTPDAIQPSKQQTLFPDIDFLCYGKEWAMCGGQFVEGYGEYILDDPVDEYFVTTINAPLTMLTLRNEDNRKGLYGGVDETDHFLTRPDIDTVKTLLDKLDPNMDYNGGWHNVIMSLNSWDMGGDVGLALAIEWSQRATNYNQTDEKIEDKYRESIPETPDFYKKLFGMVNKGDIKSFKSRLTSSKTLTDLEDIAEDVSKSLLSSEDRSTIAEALAKKSKEDKHETRLRVPYWKKLCAMNLSTSREVNDEDMSNTNVYRHGTAYCVQRGKDLFTGLSGSYVVGMIANYGFGKDLAKDMVERATHLHALTVEPDYMLDAPYKFILADRGVGNQPDLCQVYNPMFDLDVGEENEDIVNDFVNDIWAGKVDDIIKLIALTIKFKENKLNQLMIVAPTSSGKSGLVQNLGFTLFQPSRLFAAMRGGKGVGSDLIEPLKRTGLLLIDEANEPLPSDIKEMVKFINIDEFKNGGTQRIRLFFTVLTSTHKTAITYNSDELSERILEIELKPSEMRYNIKESPYYKSDSEKYESVVRSYVIRRFREYLYGDTSRHEFLEFQEKYRLTTGGELNEALHHISIEMIDSWRDIAASYGDVVQKGDEYFIKRLGLIRTSAEAFVGHLQTMTSIDKGKYVERLCNHFKGEDKNIKIDGKSILYYRLNMHPYYENKEQEVINDFDIIEEN